MGKRSWLIGLVIVALAAALWVALGSEERTSAQSEAGDKGQLVEQRRAFTAPRPPSTGAGQAPDAESESMAELERAPTYPVNLAALQGALPDNVYWALGAPTTDEKVLETRKATERRRNEAFGKIQAGEASEEEIHAYFEAQRRMHQDYFDLSTRVLSEYGESLSERDRGLYELGASMHRDRLAELPRLEREAIERKHAQDERRKAWEASGKTP